MTDTDPAVQIAADVLAAYERYGDAPRKTVAALRKAGWVHDPARVAALEKVAEWLVSMDDPEDVLGQEARRAVTLTQIIDRARAALDATLIAKRDPAPASAEVAALRKVAALEKVAGYLREYQNQPELRFLAMALDALDAAPTDPPAPVAAQAEVAALRKVAALARGLAEEVGDSDLLDALEALDATAGGESVKAQLDHVVRLRWAVPGDPSQGPYPTSVGQVADEVAQWIRGMECYAPGLAHEVRAALAKVRA